MKTYRSLREFYPHYLSEHQNPVCRKLHFVGTGLVMLLAIAFVLTLKWQFLALMPITGYGFAWVGHYFYEQNRPATFRYPWFSLASDFILFFDLMLGKEKFESKSQQGT